MSCCTDRLLCAFGPKPCFLCCFYNVKESTTTRLSYSAILVMVAALSTISHEGGFLDTLYFKHKMELDSICKFLHAGEKCARFTGYIGIYRLCLTLFCFHAMLTGLMIGVSSSQTIRGKIHNGFWLWKILLLMGVYLLAYSFPTLEEYVKIWMLLGIAGGLIFIYVQHITLIDFAYEVNGIWHAKSTKSTLFNFYIYICTLVFYLLTITAYTMFLLWYGLPHRCTLNLTVIGINGGLTALFAVCSVFSNTLRRKHLWIPGAVTSAFVAFLTWTALSSQPRILSSDVPWQKRSDRKRNISVHPLLVVADQLNRLLSDQITATSTTSPGPDPGKDSTVSGPAIMINQCLPGGVNTLSEHMGKDIFTFLGLIVVIGGSVYSSFRTTLQARRLGIRTRREKLKRLLFPIQEYPEPMDNDYKRRKPSESPLGDHELPTSEYLTVKEVKRQERALNMLAAAVSDLPNPKVFRRPSARQPQLQRPKEARAPATTAAASTSPKHKRLGNQRNMNSGACPRKALNPPLADHSESESTLRVASSVPDLTVTMKQLAKQQRTNIVSFDWHDNSSEHMNKPPDRSKRSSSNQAVKKLSSRHEPVKESGLRLDPQLEEVISQLHSQEKKTPRKRQDTKRVSSHPFKRTVLNPISDENDPLELSHLPANSSHNSTDRKFSLNGHPANDGMPSVPLTNRQVPLPSKRSSMSRHLDTPYSVLLDSTTSDTVSLCSPKHLRYELARSASELVLGRRVSRLIESQPELAASFAFLGPMLNTSAPRDRNIVYNEFIAPVYSYSWFHLIYALSTLYLMTQLTNWYNPQISRVETLSGSWANMWMKLASSWIALILYAWTIVCPRFCIGRKLGDTPFTPRTPRSLPTVSPV